MGRSPSFLGVVAALGAGVLWLAACGETEAAGPRGDEPLSGVFGGSGGVPGAAGGSAPQAGGGGAVAGSAGSTGIVDHCADVPQGQLALLDDFDDGDSLGVFEQDRDAFWFIAFDESGGTLLPGDVVAPEPGGVNGSARAVHLSASGFNIWGAQLAINVSYLPASGIRCAFNASRFEGLRFWARGSGNAHLQVSMPDTFAKEFGGTCDEDEGDVCYDSHEAGVQFEPEWTLHELPFTSFSQQGWGVPQLPLDPARIRGLMLTFKPEDQPVDVWVDSFEWFEVASEPPGGEGGAGGGAGDGAGGASQGGAGAADGEAGHGALGGAP